MSHEQSKHLQFGRGFSMLPTMSFERLVRVFLPAAMVLFITTMAFSAETLSVDLFLTPPAGNINVLEVTLTATALGITPNDTDSTTVTGNIAAELEIEFDPGSHTVTDITGLEFTSGDLMLSDISLELDFGLLVGRVYASLTGAGGTLDTPNPPGAVTDGSFNTADHILILNSGSFHAEGSGLIGGLFDPITIDLSQEPLAGTTEGTGYISVSLLTIEGTTATYGVTLTKPVDFDEEIYNDGSISIEVAVAGTLEAIGEVARTITIGSTVYVDTTATGSNNGRSWPNAYNYLQDALADASSLPKPVEIWVAAGIYKPDDDDANHPDGSGLRTDTFQLINGVGIYGGFPAGGDPSWGDRDWEMNLTTLSGDLNDNGQDNSDAYHVVYASAVDSNAILDGFTITDGYANSSGENQQGAGMFNINGAPTISNCIFINNSASDAGGGIYNGIRFNSSLLITEIGTGSPNFVEIQNVASAVVDTSGWVVIVNDDSGGINAVNSIGWSLPSSVAGGQVLYRTDDIGDNYWGSNIYWDTTGPGWAMIVDYAGNIVDFMVWGYYEAEIASLNIDYGGFINISIGSAWSGDGSTVNDSANKSFQRVGTKDHDNAADFVITSPQSKGIHNNNLTLPFLDGGPSDPTISNCAFTGNTAYSGGGIYNYSGSPTVTDCTFSGNTAGTNGGGMYNYKSSPTLTNCIFWGDSGGEVYNSGGSDPNITYSNVQGGTGQRWFGTGCIDKDPNFIAEDNLSLNAGSPCIDIGSNAAVPAEITADLAGNPRIIDGDCNDTEVVDMGAYEFNYAYMGDFDYDCDVDFRDFAILGLAWLTEPPDENWNQFCDISIPADNSIDWLDLGVFGDNWLAGVGD